VSISVSCLSGGWCCILVLCSVSNSLNVSCSSTLFLFFPLLVLLELVMEVGGQVRVTRTGCTSWRKGRKEFKLGERKDEGRWRSNRTTHTINYKLRHSGNES
jgi:hypothetical protein